MDTLRIGLIGDYQPEAIAHRAIPIALSRAAAATGCGLQAEWLPTDALARDAAPARACDGLWAVPATPYADGEAAIAAIRHAREHAVPFLGTCGGYQHALLEYARNVLGMAEARHAEEHPEAALGLIGRLACDLVEVTGHVRLAPASRLAAICGALDLEEGYHCRFGLDPRYRSQFGGGPLRIVAEDEAGDPRAFELDGHPFYFGTAFQPERAALADRDHPLITAFVRAAADAHVRGAAHAPPDAGRL
jgi:CTP synthase (UTP-ammonia lyase)